MTSERGEGPSEWPTVPMWQRAVPGGPGRVAPLVWLVGAHGGAGVSSVAASIGFAGDAQRRWPTRVGFGDGDDSPLVVLLARTHMAGLAALHHTLLAHLQSRTPAGVHLVGVLTVADSDRPLPTPVAMRRDTVESLARTDLEARTWRLGWVEPWRSLEISQLPRWEPGRPVARRTDRDATRAPPAPVQGLAEQMFTAARSAAIRLEATAHGPAPPAPQTRAAG
ncbi:hypothetical protein ACTD5D_40045 [Nocardia takedensis]|uniref:hypothetical protein n=1 Tax=Nocardia takedensis TaxID=259390 RepID=UPI003F7669C8